jgi:hypothetical protein
MKNNIYFYTGAGSWGAFEILKQISDFCSIILPILSVLSFFLFIIINRFKIVHFFSWKLSRTKRRFKHRAAGKKPS